MISTRYNVYNIHKMFFHEYDLSALSDVKFLYKTLDEKKITKRMVFYLYDMIFYVLSNSCRDDDRSMQ